MADLIRRSELLSVFKRWERVPDYNDAERHIIKAAIYETESIPAVDAVEVVRCRECMHYKPSKVNSSTAHYCGVIDGFPKEHWFCADGQRREDGDE